MNDPAGQGLHVNLFSRQRVAYKLIQQDKGCMLTQQDKGCMLIYSAGQGLHVNSFSRQRVAC